MNMTAQDHATAARRLAERATVEARDPSEIKAARLARDYAALAGTFADAGDEANAARFRAWTAAEEQRARMGRTLR
jgi:hypothetical protein